MRIVLITSKLRFEDDGAPIGGSVVDLHLKAKGLAERGHDVTVVTAFSESNKLCAPLPYRVIERRIPSRTLLGLQRGAYALLRELEKNADAFYIDGHMFLYGAGAYKLRGGRVPVTGFFNIRLNAWADTSGNLGRPSFFRRGKKRLRYAIERLLGAPLANRLDHFIFNTPHVQRLYHDFGIGIREPNSVIQDFVATNEISARFGVTADSIRRKHERPAPVVFLATGRMLPEKGFDILLRGFAAANGGRNCTLILSGDGPEKERLQALARLLGVHERVVFPGWVPRETLYRFFTEVHVFVFPRWWIEYGSAVLTEAFAFGLPCIIPRGGALEWLSGGGALTFVPDDAQSLTACIRVFAHDVEARIRHAEASLNRARALDYEALSAKFEDAILSKRA